MSEQLQVVHLPIGMGSTKYIEDLPDDVLLEIFSYLSFKDLVRSVQHVSCRWRGVAQDSHLWRKLQYIPTRTEGDEEIVNILQQTPKLRTLIFHKEKYRSPKLSTCFKNCPELRKLILPFVLCKQSLNTLVQNCQQLEHLTINSGSIHTLEDAQMIGQLQKLMTLNIAPADYGPQLMLLKPISDGCPLLQHLDVQYHIFSTVDVEYFMQMKQHQLQSIKVRWTTVEGKCTIPYLTVCKTLKQLVVHKLSNVETTAGFEALRSMKNVTALTFTEVEYFFIDKLVRLFNNKGMCHLKELKFDFQMANVDKLSETIFNNCPLLTVLGLNNCITTYRSLQNLHNLKELEYLNLLDNDDITDKDMAFVFECKHLKYLNLRGCTRLTKQCMKQLTGLNLLETLILDYCYIKGLPINLIPTLLTKLKLLSVNFSEGINLKDLHELRAKMPYLTVNADVEKEWSSSSSSSSSSSFGSNQFMDWFDDGW